MVLKTLLVSAKVFTEVGQLFIGLKKGLFNLKIRFWVVFGLLELFVKCSVL